MTLDDARTALARGLKEPGRSQTWLAELLQIAQPSVSGWVTGKFRPEPHHREALRMLFGIPEDAWLTADERDTLDRVRLAVLPPTGTEG